MSDADTPAAPAEALPDVPPAAEPVKDAQAAAALLKQLFPALFAGAPKPIMLKVQQAIEARAPGRFTKKALSGFLARHTAATSYLIALSKAEQRLDLDGQPAGPLSDEHREAARKMLAERRERVRARDAEMEAARRWRLDLLQGFETSTLSRPNFCALKGIEEAQLDALLAQAREERASLPPRQDHAPRRDVPPRRERSEGAGRPEQRREPRPGPRPEGRGPRTEGRGPRPEGQGPRPEGRGPRPEGQGPRPGGRGPRPPVKR